MRFVQYILDLHKDMLRAANMDFHLIICEVRGGIEFDKIFLLGFMVHAGVEKICIYVELFFID